MNIFTYFDRKQIALSEEEFPEKDF
jgi:hypothetical protein